MEKIIFYNLDGTIKNDAELTNDNLNRTNGMLSKITLKDGTEKVGFVQIPKENEYICLWTWKNIDEEKHILVGNDDSKYDQIFEKVEINQIENVQAKLYSNSRWGGILTNKFE